jgi:hypothetical protein
MKIQLKTNSISDFPRVLFKDIKEQEPFILLGYPVDSPKEIYVKVSPMTAICFWVDEKEIHTVDWALFNPDGEQIQYIDLDITGVYR